MTKALASKPCYAGGMRELVMNLQLKAREILMPALSFTMMLAFIVFGVVASGQQPSTQTPPTGQTPAKPSERPTPPQTSPSPRPGDDEEIIRVTSNLVVVPVSVTDATGNPVKNLKQADFSLLEAGKSQEIAQLGDPDQVPLDIALLFDVSNSISSRFAFEQEAASRFLKEVLRPTDTATIFSIGAKPVLERPRGDVNGAVDKLMSFKAATEPVPTAFYDTVTAAAQYLAQNAPKDHRRVILVISDGDDNFSSAIRDASVADYDARTGANANSAQFNSSAMQTSLDNLHLRAQQEVQRSVQRADTVFYSINPAGGSIRLNKISTRAQNGMQTIADATGGSSFVPNTDKDLERVFSQIESELRAQYLLQYYSNDQSPIGKFVPIKVAVPARPDLRVRARLGYYQKKR